MIRQLIFYTCFIGAASGLPMKPFPLSQVRLGEGIFKESMDVNRRVLDEIGVERALYCFRFNAKLPTGSAKPLEGWAAPEPYGAFPGFYESHYLSAISLLYAQTGDSVLLDRVNYMVGELAKCQEALGGNYLFASPPEEFDAKRLDGVAWYRMHKLMAGLLDARRYGGSDRALEVATKLADWIDVRMKGYGDQLEVVKKVEYGGMTEAFVNLYEYTHNPRHLGIAKLWEEHDKILEKFYHHEDYLEHANTLLAKMVGTARIAEVEHSSYHQTASENFWDLVAGAGQKTYATGGTSVHEGMPAAGKLADSQSKMPQETCVSYNLLKVTRSLFHLTGNLKYIDYYERSLFNAILGSQDADSGWKTYYQPLSANTLKDFRSPFTGCYCCNGTGLENPAQYGNEIYSHDESGLRVNLFIGSTLDWSEKGLQLIQTTRFPLEPSSLLTFQAAHSVTMDIGIRVPLWCKSGFSVTVNGTIQDIEAKPGTYAILKRTWKPGDQIACKLPMRFSKYPMPDKASQMAFLYGPLVMVGEGARPWLSELVGDPSDATSWVNTLESSLVAIPDQPLAFTARDDAGRKIRFKPYYQIGAGTFFTGYWDLVKKSTRLDDHNIALGKPTLSSCPDPIGVNVESFMRSGKAVDGQYGGVDDWYMKWFPNGVAPQWVTVDLCGLRDLSGIEWFPAAEDTKEKIGHRYKVEYSSDNLTWHTYTDESANITAAQSYSLQKTVRAQYMKLTLLPVPNLEGDQARPKLAEFKIFGSPIESDTPSVR